MVAGQFNAQPGGCRTNQRTTRVSPDKIIGGMYYHKLYNEHEWEILSSTPLLEPLGRDLSLMDVGYDRNRTTRHIQRAENPCLARQPGYPRATQVVQLIDYSIFIFIIVSSLQ